MPVASVGAPAVFGVAVGLSAPVLFGALVVCRRGAQGPEGVERLRAVPGRNLRRLERWPRPVAR